MQKGGDCSDPLKEVRALFLGIHQAYTNLHSLHTTRVDLIILVIKYDYQQRQNRCKLRSLIELKSRAHSSIPSSKSFPLIEQRGFTSLLSSLFCQQRTRQSITQSISITQPPRAQTRQDSMSAPQRRKSL